MGNTDDKTINIVLALIVWTAFILVGYIGYDTLLVGIILGGIVFIIILGSTSND